MWIMNLIFLLLLWLLFISFCFVFCLFLFDFSPLDTFVVRAPVLKNRKETFYLCCAWQYSALSKINSIEVRASCRSCKEGNETKLIKVQRGKSHFHDKLCCVGSAREGKWKMKWVVLKAGNWTGYGFEPASKRKFHWTDWFIFTPFRAVCTSFWID